MRSGCRRLASAVSILGDHRRSRRERAAALLQEMDPAEGIRAEGDIELYSDAELHKRADLRYAPDITAHLDAWWSAALKYVERDDDDDDILDKEEYRRFYVKLIRSFNNDDDDENDISVADAQVAFEQDWEADSRGDGHVDKHEFCDSVFELADQWCTTSEKDEYVQFLKGLYATVWGGAMRWRKLMNLRIDCRKFNAFDAKGALAKLRFAVKLGLGGSLGWRRNGDSVASAKGGGDNIGKGGKPRGDSDGTSNSMSHSAGGGGIRELMKLATSAAHARGTSDRASPRAVKTAAVPEGAGQGRGQDIDLFFAPFRE
eukprot:g2925.t1